MRSIIVIMVVVGILVATPTLLVGQIQSQIERAIQQDDLEKIRTVVKQDPEILNRPLRQIGLSPLHYAISAGKVDSVRTLLELKAPLDRNNNRKMTALHAALARNNSEIVDLILDKTNDVNAVDQNRSTPLMYAVMYRHARPGLVDRLLEKGADINWKNSSQQTPLHIACYYGRTDFARKFIEAGADLQAVDNNSNTPLLAACMNSAELVKQMLAIGADPLVRNRQGQTALHLACQSNQVKIVDLIDDRFENVDLVDKQYRTPLLMAVYSGNVEMARLLLRRGADPNRFNSANGQTNVQPPICYAAMTGNKDVLETLAQAGADVNVENSAGDRPLHLAAQAGGNIFGQQASNQDAGKPFIESIATLIKFRSNPNLKNKAGQTPLQVAAERDFLDAVELLVDQTEDLKFDMGTATLMHWAAKNGLTKTAKRLAALENADVDQVDGDGRTPLLVAAENGHTEVVDFLIRNKANVEQVDEAGLTAVLLASGGGHDAVLHSLIKAGADVTQLDASGQSALHLAAWNGASKVVSELLPIKELLNRKTQTGYTALHAAAWNGHTEVVGQLLKAGADFNASDSDGWTPLHKAAYRGHVDAVRELLQQGADKGQVTAAGMTALSMAEGNQKTEVVALLK